MSSYRWPVNFGLVNNNSLPVLDGTRLIGVGLSISAQLEAFRKQYGMYGPTASLWTSATLDSAWLATVDLRGTPLSGHGITGGDPGGKVTEANGKREATIRIAEGEKEVTVLRAISARSCSVPRAWPARARRVGTNGRVTYITYSGTDQTRNSFHRNTCYVPPCPRTVGSSGRSALGPPRDQGPLRVSPNLPELGPS